MKRAYIICVDDEKIVLDSIKTELKNTFGQEYIIETAEDAEEAIELFEELLSNNNDIPLVISDYLMPKLKGDELLARIHKLSPGTLTILLTGQATLEGVTNSINNANLYRYIAKPWEPHDLALSVREAIKSYFQGKKLEKQNQQLHKINSELELKVRQRTTEILLKNNILVSQKEELVQNNENLKASINYAKRIQQALLPSEEIFDTFFPESFIFSKPKDIVSGDFYWLAEKGNKIIFSVSDCTGHGVPGAFMSLLGITLLNEIVNIHGITRSDAVVSKLRERVIDSLQQGRRDLPTSDGMDIALCVVDKHQKRIQYTGGMINLVYIHDGKLEIIKADRFSVCFFYDNSQPFTLKEIDYQKGDIFYLFTDGYQDQFGGDQDKKFFSHRLYATLLDIHRLSMLNQRELLQKTLSDWKKDNIQTDDITVLGIRF